MAGLILSADGNFYGTASAGGRMDYGTIFKFTPGGTFSVLHRFNMGDGTFSTAPLVEVSKGVFYGTTSSGGMLGAGMVFTILSDGAFTSVHSFNNTDGTSPSAGLVLSRYGTLYGTTVSGGSNGTNSGTIYTISSGNTFSSFYSFCAQPGCVDGQNPFGGLLQANDGNLYGTTSNGGSNREGTIFKIATGDVFSKIHDFCALAGCADGANSRAGLIQATDGRLYGTTSAGGAQNSGTVFQVTTAGALTTQHSFNPNPPANEGSVPNGGLLQSTDGNLYGTTPTGGGDNFGTAFGIGIGLPPSITIMPAAGKAGTVIKVLGTDLAGATAVTFGGVPAGFTIVSPTLIEAKVPVNAITGKVRVVTPGATLVSNVSFRVTQ